MKTVINQLKKSDYGKAIEFASRGMHFDWYLKNRTGLELYGRYFLYSGLSEATKVLAAYTDGRLSGVLIAKMKGEKKTYGTLFQKAYVGLFELCQRIFYSGFNSYGEANSEMYHNFSIKQSPDGEIYLIAVDPELNNRGIGTLLLDKLAELEKGRLIYLYTDSGCNYGWYTRRGFDESGRKDIKLTVHGREIDLRCFLFSKRL